MSGIQKHRTTDATTDFCLNQRRRKVAGDNSVWLGRVYAAIAINKGVRIATRESATICTITLYWFTKYSGRGRHTRTVITRSLSNFQLIRRVSDYKNSNLIVTFSSTPRFLYEVYDNEGMPLSPLLILDVTNEQFGNNIYNCE